MVCVGKLPSLFEEEKSYVVETWLLDGFGRFILETLVRKRVQEENETKVLDRSGRCREG